MTIVTVTGGRSHGRTELIKQLMEESPMQKHTPINPTNENVTPEETVEVKPVPGSMKPKSKVDAPRPELSRKERRQLAKKHGYKFDPLYNDPDGVQSYEEYYGVGYERFEKIPKKRKQEQ